MRPRSAQRARRQRRCKDLIKARAHGHAEVQPPTARRPARAGHSLRFLVNNFFWKILVTLSSEKFTPVPVGTDPFAVIAEDGASSDARLWPVNPSF
jgi:hypothetical protein